MIRARKPSDAPARRAERRRVQARGPQDTHDWARIRERQMARLPAGRRVVVVKAFDETRRPGA